MSYLQRHHDLMTEYLEWYPKNLDTMSSEMYVRISQFAMTLHHENSFVHAFQETLRNLPRHFSREISEYHIVIEMPHVTDRTNSKYRNFQDNCTLGIFCHRNDDKKKTVPLFPVSTAFQRNSEYLDFLNDYNESFDLYTLDEPVIIVRLDGSLVLVLADHLAPFSYNPIPYTIFSYFGGRLMSKEQQLFHMPFVNRPLPLLTRSFIEKSL